MNERPKLPEFADPPVVETVLGVEFAPLTNWGVPHFGMFWERIRERYDHFEVQPPLPSTIETFGENEFQNTTALHFLSSNDVRCWFIDASDETLLQVQNNRFTFNWRKSDGVVYPRYENIRPEFDRQWREFVQFVIDNGLGAIEVLQCEVSYVNHLEIGKGWNSAADLAKVIAPWSGLTTGGLLPPPETVQLEVAYQSSEPPGRLRISLNRAIRKTDSKEILQLTLLARGKPSTSDPSSVMDWIDAGRELVVKSFADFTTAEMHQIWREQKRK